MPKPVLIDRWTLAVLDPKPRQSADADRIARTRNRTSVKRRVLAVVHSVLRNIPELRSLRVTRNPFPPFGG
jgi:hypothetical protein